MLVDVQSAWRVAKYVRKWEGEAFSSTKIQPNTAPKAKSAEPQEAMFPLSAVAQVGQLEAQDAQGHHPELRAAIPDPGDGDHGGPGSTTFRNRMLGGGGCNGDTIV